MLRPGYPCYLAGEACEPNTDLEVIDKYTGEVGRDSHWRTPRRSGS